MLQKLKTVVTSNVTALLFASASAITATTGWLGRLRTASIYAVCGLISVYALAWVFFLSRDTLMVRTVAAGNSKYPVRYKKVDHDWRITETGDFYGRYSFECQNVSKSNLSVIPFDEIWINSYEKVDISTRVSVDEKKFSIRESRQSLYGFALKLLSRALNVQAISWSQIVDPPIPPQDSIKYEVTISTPRTEIDAFSKEGALAGIPTNIPTEEAKLSLSAPPGFAFEFLDPIIVVDGSGNRDTQAEQQTGGPGLNPQRTLVTWQLRSPKTGKRYLFRYRLERI
ncbi:hypothetical protein LMG27952_06179 [Paraburkholderia hiiakae]|uniref:Uncharacterized protein n=2 Tax=Paraburkholderia hiiakae TaxID=1081782 RepID=A0ABM8P5B5_9BURK|nr:hypothetical protein LMG27952_06179 [Paraburkholderia hiiakae]